MAIRNPRLRAAGAKPVNLRSMEPAYLIEEEVKKPGVLQDIGITLNPDSFVPYNEQIVGQIRNGIQIGRLHAGANFYSEGEIARSLGISKMPGRHAFQKLGDEGLLIMQQGKRPVIGRERVPWDFQGPRGFSEEMLRKGLTPSARI